MDPHTAAMPQSLARILVHAVFSTQGRRPFLQKMTFRSEVHCYLGGILKHQGCEPIEIGGIEDHVHILSTLSRTASISEIIKEVKRGSSLWVKEQDATLGPFAWQSGYGAFSIGFSQVEAVRLYIRNQAEHHRRYSFQDEFRRMLACYQVAYDERYVWD